MTKKEQSNDQHEERLFGVAMAEFKQNESHANDLKDKARIFLALNSLMMSAGFLTIATGSNLANMSTTLRWCTGGSLFGLLLFLAWSYRYLLSVISMAEYQGTPSARSTIESFRSKVPSELVRELTDGYAEGASKNALVNRTTEKSLEQAIWYSKAAFATFILIATILLVAQLHTGDLPMEITPSETHGGDDAEQGASEPTASEPSSSAENGGDSDGDTTPSTESPTIQWTTLKKSMDTTDRDRNPPADE